VSSFDPWMLAYFGWLLPGVARGWLFGSDQKLEARTSGFVAVMIGADAVHPEKTLVVPERCRTWRKRGHLVNVWTVNDPAEARVLAALGVDAMVTDVPRAIVAALL
jgi:glycerophosphoryl diester phosphodiesterase